MDPRFSKFVWRLTLPLFLSLPAVSLMAQEREHEAGFVMRETREREQVEAVTEEAWKRRVPERIRRVTFGEILEDPDNLEINFLYAKNQVRDGNLLGAAATLERILMVDPDLDKVRLFYAIVLFRLDNWNESRSELQRLLGKDDLPASLRAEVKEYVRRINRRLRRVAFSVRQSVGYQGDTNRNAAPSSKKRFFADVLLPVNPSDGQKSDASFLNVTNVDVVYDLGYQAGHELFGSFTYYLQEQTEVDPLDLQSFQYQFGANLKALGFTFSPRFYASHIFLSRETFLRSQGGSFDLSRPLTQRLASFSNVRIERQDFSGITENPLASQRSGRYLELEQGFHYILTPSMRITQSILYGNKSAEEDFNAYERLMLRSGHMWLIGKGHFVINAMDLGRDVYDEPEMFVAARVRRDNTLRYRVTYGASLEGLLIGKILPPFFRDITATFAYEYFRSHSNITNYTYRNNKFQGLLTKKIDF